jgi:hypothetical protein
MTIRAWTTAFAALALVTIGAQAAPASEAPLGDAIRAVVAGNLAAYNHEDAAATMGFVHTKSPDYEPTREALAGQFAAFDVATELVGFTLIGHDDEFVVARVKVKSVAKAGSGFTNNVVDSMMIFHEENGAWKLWDEKILGVQLLP